MRAPPGRRAGHSSRFVHRRIRLQVERLDGRLDALQDSQRHLGDGIPVARDHRAVGDARHHLSQPPFQSLGLQRLRQPRQPRRGSPLLILLRDLL
eukprot:7390568-Prymnesium_polylepis.1